MTPSRQARDTTPHATGRVLRDPARAASRPGWPVPARVARLTAEGALTSPPLLGRLTAVVVCHCNVVSDREIRAHVRAGALDADDIAAVCQAGTRCGGCVPVVEALLAESGVVIRRSLTAA